MSEENTISNSRITGRVLFFIILLVGCGVLYALIGPEYLTSEGGVSDLKDQEPIIYSVKTEKIKPVSIENYLKFNGDVIAQNSVNIYPDVAGKLIDLKVSLGSYVRKGQILAYIDPSLPGQVYVASPVKSTISGTITDLPSKVGATISTVTMPIATVGNLKDLQITSYISEKYMASVELGQIAEISFEPYNGKIFYGVITEISPVLDKSSRTLEITISLDESNHLIKSGMFGLVRLITEVKEDILALPAESILNTESNSFVYVVTPDNSVHQQTVKKGFEIDGFVEIVDGLQAGDIVVLQGGSMLREGSLVNVGN